MGAGFGESFVQGLGGQVGRKKGQTGGGGNAFRDILMQILSNAGSTTPWQEGGRVTGPGSPAPGFVDPGEVDPIRTALRRLLGNIWGGGNMMGW